MAAARYPKKEQAKQDVPIWPLVGAQSLASCFNDAIGSHSQRDFECHMAAVVIPERKSSSIFNQEILIEMFVKCLDQCLLHNHR